MKQALARAWQQGHPALALLAPLSGLYALIAGLRRWLYRIGLLRVQHFPVPVVVVDNISVGGTGKTPLTLALVERLRAQGFRPGVVSRGYGGHAEKYPLRLRESTTAAQVGDEPLLLFRRTGVPVVVDPLRTRAVQHLLQENACDVVLCDDGLQHYALGRDIEIAVVDGARGFGNGRRLPAGPLREPVARLRDVDYVVVNGAGEVLWPGAWHMQLQAQAWQPLKQAGGEPPRPPARVHAVAGIGHPERFFSQLQAQGFEVVPQAFPDHHVYGAEDLAFHDSLPVVMTEKDMVKCQALPLQNAWYVPVRAELPESFYEALFKQLSQVIRTKKDAG